MPAIRNAGKNIARLREISAIVARHGFGRVFDRARIFEALRFRPKDDGGAHKRLSSAERFRQMLAELGPTFVKLGQVLSSRADLLPPDFIVELAKLQDRVPALPADVVRRVVEEGLGRPVEELFASLDEHPLASASIAQVHAARTLDGEEVVVKVQRPGISERIRADLDLLYYLAHFLERVVDETGIYSPTGIVEEFEHSLTAELDFRSEADNVRMFLRSHEGREYIHIPRVYDALSCRTVLTLERLHGVKITELDAQADRKAIARTLVDGLFEQVFVDGVFHGDPHPGNLFVLDGGRIGLVDFGLVGHLTRQMQDTLLVLCLAVALRDADTAARLIYKLGTPGQRVNLARFRADIVEIFDRYLGSTLGEIQSASVVADLIELALRHRIKVPKEYAVLTKATITIEGVLRALDPELDVVEVAMPYARRVLRERITPKAASGSALRALLQVQSLAHEVPMQLSQVLMDLEAGQFIVNARSDDMPQLIAAVRWLGIVIFSGLTASALIIGSFFILATKTDWEIAGVPVLPVVALILAPLLFGAALVWTLLAGRIHKISLRRLLGKRS